MCRSLTPFFLHVPLPFPALAFFLVSFSRYTPRVEVAREKEERILELYFAVGSHLWTSPLPSSRAPTPYGARRGTIASAVEWSGVEWGGILGHFDDYPPCSRIPFR